MKKTTFLIVGKHAVLEALKNPARKIERVFVTEDAQKNLTGKIKTLIYSKKFLFFTSLKENLIIYVEKTIPHIKV